MKSTDLDYNNGKGQLPDGAFRIGASSFNNFMTKPHEWYREKVLGESGFEGNTASVIGTCVHYCAEMVGKGAHPDKNEIEQYITNHEDNPDVDCAEVRRQYPQMVPVLINQYVLKNMPTEVEPFVSYELQPGYFPSGSIDAIQNDILVDYKTYSSKTKPKSIPMNYMYQLLIYAYICKKLGKDIQRARLVYINRYIDGGVSEKTGKPLKSYAPEVTVLTESITDDDMDFIESVMNLCIETTDLALKKPELAYMLFRDYRLKEK